MLNRRLKLTWRTGLTLLGLGVCSYAASQNVDPDANNERPETDTSAGKMTEDRLAELILIVDKNAVRDGTTWLFTIEGLDAVVVYDLNADRMRIMIPVVEATDLEPEELMRMMQANFDSALDARYAIARGMVWGTFIHPLSPLTDEEFLVGLGQTINVVLSYGGSYSSGMFVFGSGDSGDIERQRLIERLKKQRT